MLLGMEAHAVHALVLILLTCSGAHDLDSPGGKPGQPAVSGTFSFRQILRCPALWQGGKKGNHAAFGVGDCPSQW